MSILIKKDTRVLVQGITGHEGLFHTQQMVEYGTEIVAGVTPGKGGDWVLDGKIPVFDTVKQAVETTMANTSVIFVPARYSADSILEAADAGINLVVCITEGIPIQDMMRVRSYIDQKHCRLIGPNCPGLISPGQSKVGIIPGRMVNKGNIGVVSRSGTLTYEVLYSLNAAKLGVSTCVGIGGDPVKGLDFTDVLGLFEEDPHTDFIVLIGEIGGTDEERAAEVIASKLTKPVVAFVSGLSAPPGKRMGHAGAIIEGSTGGAKGKMEVLLSAGAKIANTPEEIARLLTL